jgi:hypothetical protein
VNQWDLFLSLVAFFNAPARLPSLLSVPRFLLLDFSSSLRMKATLSSEASVNSYQIRLRHISEDNCHVCKYSEWTYMRIALLTNKSKK